MAHPTIDDTTLAKVLFEVFRNHGYEGATIAQLSEATGLKKSSLYHRFPAGKEDMAKAVVSYVGNQLQQQLIEPMQNTTVSPEQRFDMMVQVLTQFYANGDKNCLLNVLMLGDSKMDLNQMLQQMYAVFRNTLIKLAKDAGFNAREAQVRADTFLMLMEGGLVIQRLTNSPQTFVHSMTYAKKQFFLKN